MLENIDLLNLIINQIRTEADGTLKHNDTVKQIGQIFRKYGFYTTYEYPIFKMKDKSGRAGRIDLVARKGSFRVAIEYDHHNVVKYKSFQTIMQIKPEVAVAITGLGALMPSVKRSEKYLTTTPLYVISLREKRYKLVGGPKVL